MAQQPLQIILMRQLAGYLRTPIFLVDTTGHLLFYNEAAEGLLGQRFEETGAMSPEEWGTKFVPTEPDGAPLSPDELPLSIALAHRRPAHKRIRIEGLDGGERLIDIVAIPLEGIRGVFHGAVALFWEVAE